MYLSASKSTVFFTALAFTTLISGMETYSLVDGNGVPLDHKLVERLNMREGVFVEVGANYGITQSNTFLLEQNYGWTGILIEPSPKAFAVLESTRPKARHFCCALGSFDEDNTYVYGDFDGHMMGSVGGKRLLEMLLIKYL